MLEKPVKIAEAVNQMHEIQVVTKMANSGERDEVYFDSVDHLCTVNGEDADSKGRREYGVWSSEPQSVSKRRDGFLRFTGFSELLSLPWDEDMYRFEERSGTVLYNPSPPPSPPSSSSSSKESDRNSISRSEGDCKSSTVVEEMAHQNSILMEERNSGRVLNIEGGRHVEERANGEASHSVDLSTKRLRKWWRFLKKRSTHGSHKPGVNRVSVRQNGKRSTELSAVYVGQEIRGHKGNIWALKFNRDGRYLASGGEDGIVRIWRVISIDNASGEVSNADRRNEETKFFSREKKHGNTSVVIPKDIFGIEEPPLHEFYGHSSDVIGLDWSNNNCLLSCSKDKTVRLWRVGCNECLHVFEHKDYVTAVEFNPVDENFFVSGSMDGKVRAWAVADGRVVDWVDVLDAVTAICYDPHGKGVVVGSTKGTCRFYTTSEGNQLDLGSEIQIRSKKRSSPNMITGIQFSAQKPYLVMITSEDSKIRVFDGNVLVHKCKGLRGSGGQTHASFALNGKHIVSVGGDSRVYLWKNGPFTRPSKRVKSTRSCESFFFDGVSAVVPWPAPTGRADQHPDRDSACSCCPYSRVQDPDNFSLRNCFFSEGMGRRSATWPEENLPVGGSPSPDRGRLSNGGHYPRDGWHHRQDCRYGHPAMAAAAWGLVLVGATQEGTITTFHNYGLPVKT